MSKPPSGGASPASTSSVPDCETESKSSDHGKRLARASIFALAIYISGAGLTSLAQMLIAKLIGPASYGIYSYAMAWSVTIAYMATLGFSVALLRFIPSYRAQGRYELARGVIMFALQCSFIAAILAGLVGAAFILFSDRVAAELRVSLLLGMAAVPLMTTLAVGAAVVRAFGGVVRALLPERILRDGLLTILLMIAAFLAPSRLDAPLVMKTVLVSSFVALAVVLITAIRLWPTDLRLKSARAARQWWAVVPPIMLLVGLDALISRIGVLVLGWTGDIRDAGIFAIAMNVALLVGLPRVAVNVMFSPTAAGLYARRSHTQLQMLFSRASLLSFAGALAIAVPLVAIVRPLLGWFGREFDAGEPIVYILIIGHLFTAFFGPQQNLLTMTGKEWVAAKTMLVGAAINMVGCWIGYQTFGTVGAAAGVAAALLVWNTSMAFYIKGRMQILPGPFAAIRNLRQDFL